MACILNIETSTPVCSVALSANGTILYDKASFNGPSHASLVGVYVEEALEVMKKQSLKLDAVAVSSGPGSYTGLRIGVSTAKGLCFGFNIPLIGIPTLKIMASAVIRQTNKPEEMLFCSMLDARRMEVYAEIYDSHLHVLREASADIVSDNTYSAYLNKQKVCFFGNGAAKCKEVITSDNALFIDNIHPLASEMIPLAEKAYENKTFEDVAYFEPFYLKEFQATIAKNKVLNEALEKGKH